MSIPPISSAAAALRAQIVGAAEAQLVSAVGKAPEGETARSVQKQPLPDPLQQAVTAARSEAAGRQAGSAPMFAELERAMGSPALPPPVRAAMAQVLAMRLPAAALSGETLRVAVARSGLFLEANLAVTPDLSAQGARAPDLKAALLVLRQVLAGAQPDAPLKTRPARTPPPGREAGLTGQAPASATLPPDADLAAIVQRIGGDAEQAIARQVLHQLASLPEGGSSARVFELPLATAQGTAIAQFEIDHDGGGGGGGAQGAQSWRVRFSLDIEPLGPVHVQLGAGPERPLVVLWAEREEGLERLREGADALAGRLAAEVIVQAGAPHRPAPPAGGLTDRSL